MLNYAKAHLLYPAAERYLKRDIRSKVQVLRNEALSSSSQRRERQKARLYDILSIANATVPYYRDLFASIGFKPDSVVKSAEALQEIPLLTKEILREQGHRMLNETMLGKIPLHERRTNGSTGLVTTVWYDQESLDWTAAVNLFASEFSGRRQVDTEVHLSSQFVDKIPRKDMLIEQVKCWALNRVNVYTHSFDDAGLLNLLQQLVAARPFSVQGHPSTLYFLAAYAQKTNTNVHGLFKVFEATGESLDQSKVRIIEQAFGCRVYNRYGNAEFGVVAHSRTKFDQLEVLDSIVIAESHSLGNGLDELVLTGLMNKAMPLIRYKTGDVGEVTTHDGLAHICRLNGRIHDIVELNGRSWPTHYIKDILERMGGLDEFQIVQRGSERIKTLKIVPNGNFDRAKVESRIHELFGDSLAVECTGFEGLVLQGWRDKFRYFVQLN